MNLIRRWLELGIVCLLSACATKQQMIVPEKIELVTVARFSVNGRASIRYPNGADYIRFSWQADPSAKNIQIYTPVGTSFAQITVTPTKAVLLQGGKKWEDIDAEALMDQLVKWHFPISGLNYWILGLAAPNVIAQWTRQKDSWCLQQSGWDIHFSDYRWLEESGKRFLVPKHIRLSNSHLTINMVVSDHAVEGVRAASSIDD